MAKLEEVIGDYQIFLGEVLAQTESHGFDLTDFVQIDHACYRTTTFENYEQKKSELFEVATLLGETLINDRPISTFRLHEPIRHAGWRIDAIELPAPKEGSQHEEGLEHIEYVLYDDIPTFLKKYDGKSFEMRAADRGINPEVGFSLGRYTIKFHLLNLTTVVYLESKLGITSVKDDQTGVTG